MQSPKAPSFKPLMISAEQLPASTARQENLTSYAAARAKLLLGCYRTGDANDPQTYVAAITAVLARYPAEVITEVTHPATGLPSKKAWLPSVKEVREACDDLNEPMVQRRLRDERIKQQFAERDQPAARPTLAELKSRYGENYGIGEQKKDKPILTMDEIKSKWAQTLQFYKEHPTRIGKILTNQ